MFLYFVIFFVQRHDLIFNLNNIPVRQVIIFIADGVRDYLGLTIKFSQRQIDFFPQSLIKKIFSK